MFVLKIFFLVMISSVIVCAQVCNPTISTVKGSKAPTGTLCSGQLIFEENFNTIDTSKWFFENTMGGI
jgi:hypothetical protein